MSKKPEKHPLNALPRNHTAEAMRKRYAGKGGAMKSRNAPRGGQRNEQRDMLEEYDSEKHCPTCTCDEHETSTHCGERGNEGWLCSLKPCHEGNHEAWCASRDPEPDELMCSWSSKVHGKNTIKAPVVPSHMVCGIESEDGWFCSLKRRHFGRHEAWAYDPDELMASWSR